MLGSIRRLLERQSGPADPVRLAKLEAHFARHENDVRRGHRKPDMTSEHDPLGGGLMELAREIEFERSRKVTPAPNA